jgi:ketosteroid isomerase-like protein
MSEQNLEVVRRYYQVFSTWLAAYWADPGPLGETPGTEDPLKRLDPEVEWDWLLSPHIFSGLDQVVQAVADWIETMDDWRVEVQELIDGRGDRVLAIVRVTARGKWSGVPVDERSFTANHRAQNGKIARIDEYIDRAEALKAVGLGE